MSSQYPWIRDSGTLTNTKSNCLAVTSPTGVVLYLANGSTDASYNIYTHSYPLYIVNDGYGTSSSIPLRNSRIFFDASLSQIELYTQDNRGSNPGAVTSITINGTYTSSPGGGGNKVTITAESSLGTSPTTGVIADFDGSDQKISLTAANGLWLNGSQITSGGGGGGVTSVNPYIGSTSGYTFTGNELYVSPTTGAVNVGVYLIGAGGTTCTNNAQGIWTINSSGGGGGGDVYWSQLNDAYTTYQNLSSGSSNNNPYTFGLNSGSPLPGNVSNSVVNMQINNEEIRYLAPSPTTSSYNIPYIKVGQNDNGSGQRDSSYTLLANVTDSTHNQYTTLATVNSNMHLYANKAVSVIPEQGTGEMYLYANNILPGNFFSQVSSGATTNLGDSNYYWASVASAIFNTISDIKTKDNIEKIDINYAKNLITKVNPVSYNLKTDKSKNKKKHFGFIAQEIKQIIGDQNLGLHIDGETQSISYTDFIAPLIKTVQYLLQKVEYLEIEVKELKK